MKPDCSKMIDSSSSDAGLEVFFSPKEVGEALGVSESSVKRWCDAGLIDNQKTSGGHRRVDIPAVINFVRRKNKRILAPEILGLRFLNLPQSLPDLRNMLLEMAGRGDLDGCRSFLTFLYADRWGLEEILDQVVLPVVDLNRQASGSSAPSPTDWNLAPASFQPLSPNTHVPLVLKSIKSSLESFKPVLTRPRGKDLIAIGSHLGDEDSEIVSLGTELLLYEMGWTLPDRTAKSSPEGLLLRATAHNPGLFFTCLSSGLEDDSEISKLVTAMNQIAERLTAGVPVLVSRAPLPESITNRLESVSSAYSMSHFANVTRKLFVI